MQRSEARVEHFPKPEDNILYLLTFAVSMTGALAALLAMPSLILWQIIPVAFGLGLVFCWSLRRAGLREYGWMLTAATAILAVLLMLKGSARFWERIDPTLGMMGPESSLGLVLLAILVLRSFAVFSAGDALFSVVPGLALYGLLAAENPGPAMRLAFLAFVLSAIILASHVRWIWEQESAQVAEHALSPLQHLPAACGIFVALVAVGLILARPISQASRAFGVVRPPHGPILAPVLPQPGPPAAGWPARSPDTYEIGSGPVRLTGTVQFTVKSDRQAYWRTRTYEIYTGRSWRTEQEANIIYSPSGVFELGGAEDARGRVAIAQTFMLEQPRRDLAAAGEPKSFTFVRSPDTPVDSLVVDGSGAAGLRGGAWIPTGAQYVATSLVPADPLPRMTDQPVPAVLNRYRKGIPLAAQEAMWLLARQIIAGKTTLLEKALALQRWVRSHGTYSLNAPAVPAGEDVVAYFVKSSNPRAYCDVYASALAMLCRAAGIPSRFAVGYLPGEYDTDAEVYVVKNSHAHAWAEVYLPPVGWVPLEATPDVAEGGSAGLTGTVGALLRGIATYAGGAGAVALAVLAWFVLLPRLRRGIRLRRVARSQGPDAREGLIAVYARALRLLARSGLGRKGWQTPLEHLEYVRATAAAALGSWLDALAQLTHDFMRARYGNCPVSAEQIARAQATVESGRRYLRQARPALKRILREREQQAL